MERIAAVLDANALFSAALRDTLVRLAIEDVFEAHWTEQIHEEWMHAVQRQRPLTKRSNLERTRRLMNAHVPGALVTGFEALIPTLHLSDEHDRHVLAAAIASRSSFIVTWNQADFPVAPLAPFQIGTLSPDELLRRLLADSRQAVLTVLREQRSSLQNPPMSAAQFLDILSRQGLTNFVTELRVDGTEV